LPWGCFPVSGIMLSFQSVTGDAEFGAEAAFYSGEIGEV
jgi:hypothetical protein